MLKRHQQRLQQTELQTQLAHWSERFENEFISPAYLSTCLAETEFTERFGNDTDEAKPGTGKLEAELEEMIWNESMTPNYVL